MAEAYINAFRSAAKLAGKVRLGANANQTLLQKIIEWQSVSDPVRVAGLLESYWNPTNTWHSYRTIILPRRAVFGKTIITNIRLNVQAVTGATWKLKIFRWNSGTSLYDFISESTFTPTETGAQSHTLSAPLVAEMSDIIGLYIPQSNTIYSDVTAVPITMRGVNSTDVTESNAFSTEYSMTPCIDVFGYRPYLAIVGDSIISGFNQGTGNYWCPIWGSITGLKTIPGGVEASEPGYIIKSIIGSELSYQNHGNTNTTWADGATNYVPKALAAHPHTLILGWGTNDIMAGVTWETVLGHLNTIKSLFDASITENLMICEILPRTQFNDTMAAIVRTWNANLAAWCAANEAILITCHDAMGQIRVSTGELDDLKTAYDYDTTHLTEAGVAAYGALIAAQLI